MKVTIISLDKWGYNDFIAQELSRRGIEVKHIDFYKLKYSYPTFFHKAINFFIKHLFNYNLKREHLNKVLEKAISKDERQDAILIIKGDNLSVKTIKSIKKNTQTLITFLNDSMARYPRMKRVYPYFDEIYSFDPDDVVKHHFKLITNYIYFDYQKTQKSIPKYGVFNISSLDKRTKTMPQFARYFRDHQIDYKLIAFSDKYYEELENLNIEQTKETFSLEMVFELVKDSKYLLDLQRPKQKGLSFRIFEGIALEKKIITTNKDIVNYDFYDDNNIAVVDPNDIYIPDDFFTSPYKKLDENIVKKYHISTWVNTVFNLENV
ncbi:hypothetical protein C1T31_04815 [Hanstruepera neustonica]|uniref:Lipopolysaccharide core biosynthesis protein rfaS n=1 Tax=Hanstruepera neustonica TaxID=1445657 RepID=A0A2K1E059_9FLAO|nr:hypothetical protein [Hanstruepera neustonica]PNQ73663.1 hypothetical protein C1T31_04815 [Hanstruepera neustonica]